MIYKASGYNTLLKSNDQGIAQVVANSTNIFDKQGDNIVPGAWGSVIQACRESGDYPAICQGHDWNDVIGKVTDLYEALPGDGYFLPQWHIKAGAGALIATVAFNLNTQKGRDAWSNMKFLGNRQFSVGFMPSPDGCEFVQKGRLIKSIDSLPEISVVLVGASPGTSVLTSKAGRKPISDDAIWQLAVDEVLRQKQRQQFTDAELAALRDMEAYKRRERG